jgi:hypothetical protein
MVGLVGSRAAENQRLGSRTMTLHGHIQNGVIILDHHGPLPEGAAVEVQIIVPGSDLTQDGATPTLAETLKGFIGVLEDLPDDASTNHDHYLYGAPKKKS